MIILHDLGAIARHSLAILQNSPLNHVSQANINLQNIHKRRSGIPIRRGRAFGNAVAFLFERASLFQKSAMTEQCGRVSRELLPPRATSRHREIIAINATGAGEDVPVFERDDYMSLSNRQAAIEQGDGGGGRQARRATTVVWSDGSSWRHHVGNHG